jgi:hypothetical protein
MPHPPGLMPIRRIAIKLPDRLITASGSNGPPVGWITIPGRVLLPSWLAARMTGRVS